MKAATQEAVTFLMQEKGLSARDAYQLASIEVDFHVTEAVKLNQVVYGMLPKNVFKKLTPYWHKPQRQHRLRSLRPIPHRRFRILQRRQRAVTSKPGCFGIIR